MVSPWDCGRFIAPFDMVGNKFSGTQVLYRGSPTNSGNSCEYFTETQNGIRVLTRTEMSYPASNAWNFSVLPQKRNGATEINLVWKDNGKETTKQWTMPNEGGAIVQRRFSNDPTRNQLIIFSSQRLPRELENKSDKTKAEQMDGLATLQSDTNLIRPTVPSELAIASGAKLSPVPISPQNHVARTNLIYTLTD